MRASYNAATGMVEVNYAQACDATDHTIYFGDLGDVASYLYSDAECNVGNTGAASFDPGGMDRAFFVIVGNNAAVEGSFGVDGAGAERPEDLPATTVCELPQDLTGTCN
jgi:hypothetical protein